MSLSVADTVALLTTAGWRPCRGGAYWDDGHGLVLLEALAVDRCLGRVGLELAEDGTVWSRGGEAQVLTSTTDLVRVVEWRMRDRRAA